MSETPLATNCSPASRTSTTMTGVSADTHARRPTTRNPFPDRPGVSLRAQRVRPTPDGCEPTAGHPRTGRERARGLRVTERSPRTREREKVFAELGQEETDEALASMVAFAYLGVEGIVIGSRRVSSTASSRGRLSANSPNQLVGRPTRTCPSRSSTTPISRRCISVSRTVRNLTDAEIGAVVRAGRIDRDDLDELAESSGDFPRVFVGRRSEPEDGTVSN